MTAHKKILILDFGSQYTQLIARRVRESNVYFELHPWDMAEADIRAFAPSGIILSGGPSSVYEEETPKAPQVVFELGVPVLGICYGMQIRAARWKAAKCANSVTRKSARRGIPRCCAAFRIAPMNKATA